jgi:hypothetical protein
VNTDADSGFNRLAILAELRDRLNEHYRAASASPQKHPRMSRSRRWRPLALIAMLVLGGATGALAAAGVFDAPSLTQRWDRYIQPALLRALNGAACAHRTVPATTTAVPPASLLSIVGVLRRPAARRGAPAAVLSTLRGEYPGLYVNYVRFAGVVDGLDWYVSVSRTVMAIHVPAHLNRCVAAQTADFDRALAHIPAAMRAEAIQMFNAQVRRQRSYDAHVPQVGVNADGFAPESGVSGAGVSTTAAGIGQRGLAAGSSLTGSGPDTATVMRLVPDGVASVTLHYDAGPASAYGHDHAPAATITTTPFNNIMVVTVPRNTGNAFPQAMIWRAANGTTIKTFREP